MPRICFLADAGSIHTQKWAEYLSQQSYELYIISMRDTSYSFKGNVKVIVLKAFAGGLIKSCKLLYLLLIPEIRKLMKK